MAQGKAMLEEGSFAKAVVVADKIEILYAPILVQEVINVMTADGDTDNIMLSINIHPLISELLPELFSKLENPQAE